ncbi:hypothetical protein FEM48_Zijuj07G0004200 [Ziziphus jujuba var. spinosa]|uniref:Uncharacterized protein n=1 Tax=Ziziphus jujuba var. spinosa TaxID=714518 RepID=A0A978V1D2_ZIZJJ|nr:hypothetical protein FEM48_Zijuj07G0004200 [Ziziphus jujuba var. spinosa]
MSLKLGGSIRGYAHFVIKMAPLKVRCLKSMDVVAMLCCSLQIAIANGMILSNSLGCNSMISGLAVLEEVASYLDMGKSFAYLESMDYICPVIGKVDY